MSGFKVIGFFIRWLAFAVWGISFIEVFPILAKEGFDALAMFKSANSTITFLTASGGFVFFVAKGLFFIFSEIPHKRKTQQLERDIMEEDLIQKRHENGAQNALNSEKKNKGFYGKTVINEMLLFLVA